MKDIAAIDLFCGIGGLTYGVQSAGIPIICGYDIEESCKYAFENNNNAEFICKNILELTGKDISDKYPENTQVRILMGCAPCQPFSSYNFNNQDKEIIKEKIDLLDSFGKIVEEALPDIVSMENVPQMAIKPVFKRFVNLLKKNNYHVSWKVIFAPDYGVPQNRKRLVLLASRLGEIDLIPPTHTKENYVTTRDAIGNLPPISHGETHPLDSLHASRKLSDINIRRIIQSKPGGSWKDWDEELKLNCHKKDTGKSYGSVYGRMEWDKPAPTITTQFYGYGNGRFGHPIQNRALSHREGAILQTFPNHYKFYDDTKEKFNSVRIGTQIGNAVPPRLGEVIGLSIKSHLERIEK